LDGFDPNGVASSSSPTKNGKQIPMSSAIIIAISVSYQTVGSDNPAWPTE
jgi:hypothetical protein